MIEEEDYTKELEKFYIENNIKPIEALAVMQKLIAKIHVLSILENFAKSEEAIKLLNNFHQSTIKIVKKIGERKKGREEKE